MRSTATDREGAALQGTGTLRDGSAPAAGITFTAPLLGSAFEVALSPVAAPAAATLTILVEDPRGNAAGLDLLVVRSGAPAITAVAPDSAFASRPQTVTITGGGLSLGGSVVTTLRFDGAAASGVTTLDDTTLRGSTPASLAPGPTVVGVSNAFADAHLPDTAFTAYAFPPVLAAADTRLDAGAGTSAHLARDGDAVHAVWLEGEPGPPPPPSARGARWGPPQTLSGGEVASEPRVAVVGGDVVVTWIGGGNSVLARTSHDGGASFAAAATLDSGTTVSRPRLAASGARRHVVWIRGTTGLGTARLVATASADAGDTWRAAALVGDGGANQHSHELAASGARAWLAFVDERDGAPVAGVYTARTDNGGTFWEAGQRRSIAGAAAQTPLLCETSGTVWVAWLRGAALEYMGSADAGLSWPVVHSVLRNDGGAVGAPMLACTGTRLYAIYLLDGPSVEVSRLGGIGATPVHVTVSGATGPAGEPTLAARGNYVVAAWRDGAVAGGTARIVTAVSTDLGATFTGPTGFGDASAAQEQPQLGLDSARLALLFVDHRTTPAGLFANATIP